jgi:hypothetical protein
MSRQPSAGATCISISRNSPVTSYNAVAGLFRHCPVPSGWNRLAVEVFSNLYWITPAL